MSKTEVYSWRLSAELKHRLEARARSENVSVARLVERIVRDSLSEREGQADEAEQERLHAAVETCIGSTSGGDPTGSRRESIRARIRTKLSRRRRARTA